ncbi:MAG: DPP IV N-terminal domain-containing protein, partial [Gammaproteobacteria bacterium]
MKTSARLTGIVWLTCAACAVCAAEPAPPAPGYTIAQIYAEPGLSGYHPEQPEWSPDGRSLTYLLRSDADGLADLYLVDVASGKRTLLLSAAQLASAAAPPSNIKNQREQERITRYGVAAYHWSPKADAIFYLSNEQIYLHNLATHQTTQITHEPGAKRNPQISPNEQWVSYVTDGAVHYVAIQGGPVHSVAPHQADVLNGELNWVYTEELDLRSAYTWAPDSRYIAFLQSDERPVHGFPLINYIEPQPGVYEQKYPLAGAPNPIVRLGVRDVQSGKTT